MVSVDGLTVEFGGTTLFKDISFVINDKDRIALMGKNGAGKSTLLKILAGVRQASRGSVSAPKDTTIAYLPQHLMTEDGRTVFEEASQAFAHLHKMEAEIEAINKQLAERTDYESDEYMALIEQVATISANNDQNIGKLRGRRGENAARTGIRTHGLQPSDVGVFWRMAHAYRTGQDAAAKSRRIAPRRTDEPPRHREYRMAGRFPHPEWQGRGGDQPRPQIR